MSMYIHVCIVFYHSFDVPARTAILIIIEGQFQAFQGFSSSKPVLKTVESRFAALNYDENGSTCSVNAHVQIDMDIYMHIIHTNVHAYHTYKNTCISYKDGYVYIHTYIYTYKHTIPLMHMTSSPPS
jgi:hypothetical protein